MIESQTRLMSGQKNVHYGQDFKVFAKKERLDKVKHLDELNLLDKKGIIQIE